MSNNREFWKKLKTEADVDQAIRDGKIMLRSECVCCHDDEGVNMDDPLERLLASGEYFVQSEWHAENQMDVRLTSSVTDFHSGDQAER
jgi:hypothetical protein